MDKTGQNQPLPNQINQSIPTTAPKPPKKGLLARLGFGSRKSKTTPLTTKSQKNQTPTVTVNITETSNIPNQPPPKKDTWGTHEPKTSPPWAQNSEEQKNSAATNESHQTQNPIPPQASIPESKTNPNNTPLGQTETANSSIAKTTTEASNDTNGNSIPKQSISTPPAPTEPIVGTSNSQETLTPPKPNKSKIQPTSETLVPTPAANKNLSMTSQNAPPPPTPTTPPKS